MSVDVAVVVVTYNSAEMIEGNLASLSAALGTLTASVRIVDNGSADGTADLVDALDHRPLEVRVVRSSNEGYAAGINRGVRNSPESKAVLVLNPDVRLDEGCVEALYAGLSDSRVGIVAPKLRDETGRRANSLRRSPSLGRASGLGFTGLAAFSEYVTAEHAYRTRHTVDWATGAVLLVSRACHDQLGGWDESYFLYSEETDLSLRAADLGWRTIYEPSASAIHIGGQSGRNHTTHTMQIANRVRLYARRNGAIRGWLYYALTVASEASWALRGHGQSRAAIRALLQPSSRPEALAMSHQVLPR